MFNMRLLICSLALIISHINASEVTFNDVTVHGYSFFVHKFEKKITSSSLKDDLPADGYDKLEIKNENIPVIYEGAVADLENLDELILEQDSIEEIKPNAFRNLPALRKLSLKGNKLKEISTEVFNQLSVATLDLSENSISTIASDAFDNMPDLININLGLNKLSFVDQGWFKNSPLLSRVSLHNNLITSLPARVFKNLSGDKKFGNLDLQLSIILSYNQISSIDAEAFKDIKKIHNLWLDHNQLITIDENLFKDIKIDDLRIGENKIDCLGGDLQNILHADSVDIDGNPWNCTCLMEIKDWAKKNDRNIQLFYSDMDCSAQRIHTKIVALQNRLNELNPKKN